MIFKKHKKSIKDYAEYETIIESLLQKDNNNQILSDFIDKITTNHTVSSSDVLLLTNIAHEIQDTQLKLLLYEKIIEELVLTTYGIYERSENNQC